MKFVLTQNAKGQWWFELVARNGRKLGNQWYSREAGAYNAINAIAAEALKATIVEKPWKAKRKGGPAN